MRCRPPQVDASCRGPPGTDNHQCASAGREQAMSHPRIGELTTDAGEVVHVDECDVVDHRRVDVTDQVALEKQPPTTVGIGDRLCAPKSVGEVIPERPVVTWRDLSETAMRTEGLR